MAASGLAGAAPTASPARPAPPPSPARAAAAVACKEVPEAETHLAVLMSSADVLVVRELKANERVDGETIARGDGARIVLADRPYSSSGWLERVIGCHLARNAAQGRAPQGSTSPLDVEGAVIVVSGSTPGTLVVDVMSSNPDSAREIVARARALMPRPPAQATK